MSGQGGPAWRPRSIDFHPIAVPLPTKGWAQAEVSFFLPSPTRKCPQEGPIVMLSYTTPKPRTASLGKYPCYL